MSEENQSGNQSQASSDNQTGASNENTQPKLQAVESKPKPEPSYERIEFSEDVSPLTLEKRGEPLPKPGSSFETHLRSKSSKTVEKRDKTE